VWSTATPRSPLELAIADAVAAVPANRPENDLAGEVPPPEHGHQPPPPYYLPGVPCRAQAIFATVRVRERYTSAAMAKSSCCGPKVCCNTSNEAADLGLDMIGDAYQTVDGYLPEADLGLGCGLPTQHAGIWGSDVVLDLGSGRASMRLLREGSWASEARSSVWT
jgi:hypothetical protein